MDTTVSRTVFHLFLALVFTIGLTFATVELPYMVDSLLQSEVHTPGFDSHADDFSEFKTDLFISHYHLRVIGYVCLAITVLLVVVGFATKRTGFAAIGAVAFMLPVFAQFAGVMFFLAGLGLLNVFWLPILESPIDVGGLGSIMAAPYDLLMWLFSLIGIHGYWYIVYSFIGGGLLIFFLGTFAWLSAKARDKNVADFWLYRFSRHPQYIGWILWSYGMYLLLLQNQYPKRSWGLDASLPWLISTVVIIGVAMLEELKMSRRYGTDYDAYRDRTHFMLPMPKFLGKIFTFPNYLFFHRRNLRRRREVGLVLAVWTLLLVGGSALFYGGGIQSAAALVRTDEDRLAKIDHMIDLMQYSVNWREQYRLVDRLADIGSPAVASMLPLLHDDRPEIRILAAKFFSRVSSPEAVPLLIDNLYNPHADVRGRAVEALRTSGDTSAIQPMMHLLDDSEDWVRGTVAGGLAALGASAATDRLLDGLDDPNEWLRVAFATALGDLQAEKATPKIITLLSDGSPRVRRAAVVALLQIGSPEARPALEMAARDEDGEVRLYAAEALRRLKKAVP